MCRAPELAIYRERQKEKIIQIEAIEKDYVEIACELWLQARIPSFTYGENI